jgi:8-oxo-dGTP pyrophosphatase MutT (NUDIX family)
MRLLFEMDTMDYKAGGKEFVRPSARGIIIRGGRVAMVYSKMYDYYKFPGGGIEDGEDMTAALVREVREEAGLSVIRESVRELGLVHRVERTDHYDADIFVQDNYYYLCEVEAAPVEQSLDDYEREEGFTLVYVEPRRAIEINRTHPHGPKSQNMLEREARVLEILLSEGYFEGE